MYFLFSLLSLSFWACEQRPELGEKVIFQDDINTKTTVGNTSLDETSEKKSDQDVKDTTSTKSNRDSTKESDQSVDKQVDSNINQESELTTPDPFAQDDFVINSSEMDVSTETPISEEPQEGNTSMEIVDVREQFAITSTQWPIQVIAITDSSPKRAILRFAEGKEITVQAGRLLEQEKIVVLAIGKNHVSLARIEQQGDVTSIQQIDIQSLN